MIIPILQMRKLGYREVENSAQNPSIYMFCPRALVACEAFVNRIKRYLCPEKEVLNST